MSAEQIKAAEEPVINIREASAPLEALETQLPGLARFGGFDLLESAIDDVQNLNPSRKARRKIFLEEPSKKDERAQLQKTLEWWLEVLQSSEELVDMIGYSNEKAVSAQQT